MRISSLKNRLEAVRVIGEITASFKTDTVTYSPFDVGSFDGVGHSFVLPDEDCFLIIEQGSFFDIIRVGAPPIVMILKDDGVRTLHQFDEMGNLVSSIESELIFQDYYRVIPSSVQSGYFESDGLTLPFKLPYITPTITGDLSGSITCQPGWQLICIPTIYGKWESGHIVKDTTPATVKNYIIDQLCEKMSITDVELRDYVQVLNAMRGGQLSQNYVVGLTSETSVNNFRLAYQDETSSEIEFTAFWIKVLQPIPDIEWEFYGG